LQPSTPCDVCDYLSLCRGGCHVVAKQVLGDMKKPDPGCPTVRRYYDSLH
jgi:radical SAM protein with 4Fe4S-binding SPASM domain